MRGVTLGVLIVTLAMAPAAASESSRAGAGSQGRLAYSERFWPKDDRIVDNWEILVRKVGGRASTNLTRNPRCDDLTPAWSHDGRWIAFACDGGRFSGIEVIGENGSGRKRVVRLPNRRPFDPAWSPDDRKLAFALGSGIWTVNVDGSGLRRLSGGRDSSPTWSADGRTMAFQRRVRGVFAVVQMRAGGGGQHVIARNASEPTWSPDGKTIAYISRGALWLMDPDGSRQRRVPRVPRAGGGWGVIEAAWSPDSRYLAYQHYGTESTARGVHAIAVDGTSRRLLFKFLDPLPGIAWGPLAS
jgi:dipeptidyl aminopeptidase/acylaminoacyl peptidase